MAVSSGSGMSPRGASFSTSGKGLDSAVKFGEFAPDGKVALLSDGNTVCVWGLESEKLTQEFYVPNGVRSLALLPGAKQAMTDSDNGAVRLWDIETGKELVQVLRLEDEKGWVAITPDGLADGTPALLDRAVYRVGQEEAAKFFIPVPRESRHADLLSAVLDGRQLKPMGK